MRIRKNFYFNLALGALLFVAAMAAFFAIQSRLGAAVAEKEMLDRFSNDGMELVQGTGEVLLYGERRAIRQWRDLSGRFAHDLAKQAPPENLRARDLLLGLRQTVAEMIPLFDHLTALSEDERATLADAGDRLLSSQLFRKSVQMQAMLRELQRVAQEDLEARHARTKALMFYTFGGILVVLGGFGVFVFGKFHNYILQPLGDLQETVAAYQRGEQSARATVLAEDEIGIVGQTLNLLFDKEQANRREIMEAADKFRAIFEQAAVGIARVGLDGRLWQVNNRFSYIVGLGPEELTGKLLADLIAREDLDAEGAQLADLLDGKRHTYTVEKRLRRDPAAGAVWVNQTVSLVRDAVGMALYYVYVFEDITARRQAEGKAEFLTYHDALTGLPNQLLVKVRLEQAQAHADRRGDRIAMVFIDLDNFKSINDSLGHAIGDILLKTVATRLLTGLREGDMVSRKGGDEFLVILTEVSDADDIGAIADKLIDRLAAPVEIDGMELSTTASLGIAIYPDDSRDFDTLLKKADTAMYQAKAAGRNAYRFFTEQMNRDASEYLAIRNGLRQALAAGGFRLHYQPQADLETGRIIGVEALLRWVGGPPARFIPVAEESGLIVPIGNWVIREACRQMAAWDAAGLPALTVAVNLSALQFQRADLEETVLDALKTNGIAPQRLELELTESTLIQDTESVIVTLGRFKNLGIGLSIDDFGTGYSSLSYLKRFNIDRLKIDQSFVRGLATDQEYLPIVRAIIQLAQSYGLRTVAEGVEDARTLERLRLLGCNEVQGYYLARPMPPEELQAFLVSHG